MKYLLKVVRELMVEIEIKDGEEFLDRGAPDQEDKLPYDIIDKIIDAAEEHGYSAPCITGFIEKDLSDPNNYRGDTLVLEDSFVIKSCKSCRKYESTTCVNDSTLEEVDNLSCWEDKVQNCNTCKKCGETSCINGLTLREVSDLSCWEGK